MLKNEYPLIKQNNYEYTTKYKEGITGIYECEVNCEYMHIPLLPYKDSKNKLLFPYGKFKGFYTNREIEKAYNLGYDIKIISGYVFNECEYIFKEYVEHYYNIKKNSEGSKKEIAKLLLNSLYGKFGQKRKMLSYSINNNTNVKTDNFMSISANMNITKSEKYNHYSKYLHSEISALITADARLELYKLIERAGIDNVYYYDTDSIITSYPLNCSAELGQIKKVAELDEFICIGAKLYAYKTKNDVHITAKGFNVADLKYTDFLSAYKGDISKIHTNKESVRKFRSSLVSHSNNFANTYNLDRTLRNEYNKRIVLSDNINTKPYKIG